jgi:hypothetical protein
VALVGLGVTVALEVGEAEASSLRAGEDLVHVLVGVAQGDEQRSGALDQLDELRPLPAQHNADGILPVALFVA